MDMCTTQALICIDQCEAFSDYCDAHGLVQRCYETVLDFSDLTEPIFNGINIFGTNYATMIARDSIADPDAADFADAVQAFLDSVLIN